MESSFSISPKNDLNIVFFGSSEFAVPALERLNEVYQISTVVSQPDSISGRGNTKRKTPVAIKAEELGLETFKPEKASSTEAIELLKSKNPDLFVVASYGQILKKAVLDIPKHGTLNIHASLLPKYRGAAPIQRAIENGDEYSGVTIMELDEGLDTGNIVLAKSTSIDEKTTADILHNTLAEMGAELVLEAIPGYISGEIISVSQDEEKATYAEKIRKEEAHIDFSLDADTIIRRVNAFDDYPGAYSIYNGKKRIKLFQPEYFNIKEKIKTDLKPGTILEANADDGLVVACGNGAVTFREIQFPNKKRMLARNFFRGNSMELGVILN